MNTRTLKAKLSRSSEGRQSEWLFGMSGKATFLTALILVLLFCFIDTAVPGGKLIPTYAKHIVVNCLIYAILSLGLDFVAGYIGQVSLGHAAFFGLGAYVTGSLSVFYGVNFWITIPIGMIISGILSVPLAFASQKVKGPFLVVITYGFCEILRYVAINTSAWGGTSGLPGIKTPTLFGIKLTKLGPTNKDGYILILFAIVAFLAFFTWRVVKSRIGYAFAAIREDEIAAVAMGINTKYYKLLAIVISACICSIAGSFQAVFASFISPELFASTQSISMFTMVVVGGRRSIIGMILGAGLMTILPELFRMVQELFSLPFDPWMILYSLILIVMMRFRPQGIWGREEKKK